MAQRRSLGIAATRTVLGRIAAAVLGAVAAGGLPGAAVAQPALEVQPSQPSQPSPPSRPSQPAVLEEVVVTGSAIRRTDLDQALPVTVYGVAEIQAAGVSNINEFIEKLPAMQNMTVPGDSVGGGGAGGRTANLRGIGSAYTLTLLNGRRMSPFGSGSTVNLSAIPLAAIDRVEVLKEGASALYGSDAIAGVVNFILKDSVEGITVSTRIDEPLAGGGDTLTVDVVTGFGDFDADGYSLMFGYSRENQDALAAVDRPFADTGFITFSEGGKDYYFDLSSSNSIPGNAHVYTAGWQRLRFFNPDRLQNAGECAPQTTPDGESCRFDFTATLDILPEHELDSLFANGRFSIGDNLTGFVTALYSENRVIESIAPYPTGQVSLPIDSDIVRAEVFPHLTPEEAAAAGRVTGQWRAYPAGNRTSAYDIETANVTFGLEGSRGAIDYDVALSSSSMVRDADFLSGYLLAEPFLDLVGSGRINIFARQNAFMDADILAPTLFNGNWSVTDTEMYALDATASLPVFELPGGEATLAAGADWRDTQFADTPSEANRNAAVLYLDASTPYRLQRAQYGVFAELLLPVTNRFELTGSLRYDDYGPVEDRLNGRSLGDGHADETWKLGALFRATDRLAFRGSYGTGFKAPSMTEIGAPRADRGVTGGDYACPFEAGDPLAALCLPGRAQYAVVGEGRADLTFETSGQWALGVALTPLQDFDLTIDYWSIEVDNIVVSVGADSIFNDPEQYRDRFTTRLNTATGQEELAIIQSVENGGTHKSTGIDVAVNKGFRFGGADLTLGLTGTWLDEVGGALASGLDRFASGKVWFERLLVYSANLEHGRFTHNLRINYRSGYDDHAQWVELLGTGVPIGQGPQELVQLRVDEQYLADYRLRYSALGGRLGLTLGINNLTDKEPPLSLRNSGSHQVGWDPRYADGYGRTVYLGAEYTF